MKDEILIRYINKHCTATEEKEILEWLKEKDTVSVYLSWSKSGD